MSRVDERDGEETAWRMSGYVFFIVMSCRVLVWDNMPAKPPTAPGKLTRCECTFRVFDPTLMRAFAVSGYVPCRRRSCGTY